MSALIISQPLPATSVTVAESTVTLATTLAEQARQACTIMDNDTFKLADAIYQEVQAFAKALEANREEVKAPYLRVCKEIDAGAKRIVAIIDTEKARLGAAIKSYQLKENARLEAARVRALQESVRAEREAYDRAEAQRKAEIAANQALPPDERAANPPVFSVPTVAPVAPVFVPPPLVSSVRTKKTYQLIINDASKIPYEIAGVRLLVPDLAAIKALMIRGMAIAGCELVTEETTAPTGR